MVRFSKPLRFLSSRCKRSAIMPWTTFVLWKKEGKSTDIADLSSSHNLSATKNQEKMYGRRWYKIAKGYILDSLDGLWIHFPFFLSYGRIGKWIPKEKEIFYEHKCWLWITSSSRSSPLCMGHIIDGFGDLFFVPGIRKWKQL